MAQSLERGGVQGGSSVLTSLPPGASTTGSSQIRAGCQDLVGSTWSAGALCRRQQPATRPRHVRAPSRACLLVCRAPQAACHVDSMTQGPTVPGHPQHHSQGATAARHSELRAAGRAAQEAAGEQGGSWGLGQARLLSAAHAHARAAGRLRAAARPAAVTRPLAVSWGGRRGWPHTSRHPPG